MGGEGQWVAAGAIKGLTFAPANAPPPGLPGLTADAGPSSAPATADAPRQFTYKMVQVPPTIQIPESESARGKAAAYLEGIVNEYADKGWEFYRVDEIGIRRMPGLFDGFPGPTAEYGPLLCRNIQATRLAGRW